MELGCQGDRLAERILTGWSSGYGHSGGVGWKGSWETNRQRAQRAQRGGGLLRPSHLPVENLRPGRREVH